MIFIKLKSFCKELYNNNNKKIKNQYEKIFKRIRKN